MPYLGNSPQNNVRNRYYYNATAGQTVFSGQDINGISLKYQDGKYLDVYLNGVLLQDSIDYTATDLSSVTLLAGATAGDLVEIVSYGVFSVADTVTTTRGGTFNADIGVNGNLTVSGVNIGVTLNAAFDKANTGGGGGGAAIPLVADSVNATRYIMFANNTTGNLITANVSTGLNYNAANGYTASGSYLASNWFRSTGSSGWYNQTNGGGIWMDNNSQVKVYGSKQMWSGPFAAAVSLNDSSSQFQAQNAGGTGDGDVAAYGFHCSGYYGMKIHLRADGYFGWGGWSASAWRFYQYLSTGDVTAAGNITAYSDIRLKENITPLTDSLYKIKQLNGVRFTWKDLPDIVGAPGKADFGILAHEVEAIAPELISPSAHLSPDGDHYKTVAYDKLVPMLIEAIKEMSDKMDTMQKEIDQLKSS